MATRIGFTHVSNRMRSRWEEGIRKNREKKDFLVALFKTCEREGGWETSPEYMRELEHKIKLQEQYLRNRGEL